MQIFIKLVNGKTILINVKSEDTINNVKEKIYEKVGIPLDYQLFIYGKYFIGNNDNNNILSNYNITQDSTLQMIYRLLSCSLCKKIDF